MKRVPTSKDPLTPEQRERYEKVRRELKQKLRPLHDAIAESRRITADDMKLRVNW